MEFSLKALLARLSVIGLRIESINPPLDVFTAILSKLIIIDNKEEKGKNVSMKVPKILQERYTKTKQNSASQGFPGFALEITATDRIGLIADISSAVSRHKGNVTYIESWVESADRTHTTIQICQEEMQKEIIEDISNISCVKSVKLCPTHSTTWGKRVIVLGGGAQVAQVANGAIAEADRHNIRGETISVDTIAVVGEENIAKAVRGIGRLHRASIVVLAGALMGGDISKAVGELRETYGIPVISLKMAGSVNKVSDLTVTDPIEAGVMAVMLISNVGKFNLLQVEGKCY
jgi:energy-converting hydrogenase B subunit Q